jgi:hypothetical protein
MEDEERRRVQQQIHDELRKALEPLKGEMIDNSLRARVNRLIRQCARAYIGQNNVFREAWFVARQDPSEPSRIQIKVLNEHSVRNLAAQEYSESMWLDDWRPIGDVERALRTAGWHVEKFGA